MKKHLKTLACVNGVLLAFFIGCLMVEAIVYSLTGIDLLWAPNNARVNTLIGMTGLHSIAEAILLLALYEPNTF